MLALCLLVLGIFSRLMIHAWNFTPVIAIALFGGVYLKKRQALLLPLLLLALSDVILGLHETILFTWGSVVLITAIGFWIKRNKSITTMLAGGLSSVLIFFVVSNFGVWLVSGLYAPTWAGLVECFVMAVPFLRNTVTSTLIYGVVLFGAYEVVAARVKNTRLSFVL